MPSHLWQTPEDRMMLAGAVAAAAVALLLWALLSSGNTAIAVTGFALVALMALGSALPGDGRRLVGGAAAVIFIVVALVWGATAERGFVEDGLVPALLVLAALCAIAAVDTPETKPDTNEPRALGFDDWLRVQLDDVAAANGSLALVAVGLDFPATLSTMSRDSLAELASQVQQLAGARDRVEVEDDAVLWGMPATDADQAEEAGAALTSAAADSDGAVHAGIVVGPDDGANAEALRREAAHALDFARLRGDAIASRGQLAASGSGRPAP